MTLLFAVAWLVYLFFVFPIIRSKGRRHLYIAVGVLIAFVGLKYFLDFMAVRQVRNMKEEAVLDRQFATVRYDEGDGWKSYGDLIFDLDRYYFLPPQRLAAKAGDVVSVYATKQGVTILCAKDTCTIPKGMCLLKDKTPFKCERSQQETYAQFYEQKLRPLVPQN